MSSGVETELEWAVLAYASVREDVVPRILSDTRADESVAVTFSRGDATMVHRKVFPAYGGYDIAVASEQMRDGKWSAVASITHSTNTSRRAIDLPVPSERFESEEDAERFVVNAARDWIEQNVPSEGQDPSRAA